VYNFFSRRPTDIEEFIVDRWEPSSLIPNAFSKDETKKLISIFKKAPKAGADLTFYKMFDDCLNSDNFDNTFQNPKPGQQATACSAPCMWDEGTKEIVDPVLRNLIGEYKIIGGKFNLTMGPYRLHTDSGKHPDSKIYKQIIIPIMWDTSLPVYTMLFNQRWTGCQARFQQGVESASEEKFETPTHMTITDYKNSDIFNLEDSDFNKEDYTKYLTHIDYRSLWGFSVELAAKWEPQCLIYYDRSVIHSSCHFAQKNLKSKLFLTLVTEYPDDSQ
jgi:hypothetical protein